MCAHVWVYEHESRLMGRPEVLEPLELGSTWLLDTWYDCWELKSGSLQVEYTLLTLSHLSSPSSSCMCVHVSVYVCVRRKGRPECVRLSSATTLSIPGSRVSPWTWGLVSWIGWKPARPSNPLIFLVGGIIGVYGLPGLLNVYYTSELGSFQICGKY